MLLSQGYVSMPAYRLVLDWDQVIREPANISAHSKVHYAAMAAFPADSAVHSIVLMATHNHGSLVTLNVLHAIQCVQTPFLGM